MNILCNLNGVDKYQWFGMYFYDGAFHNDYLKSHVELYPTYHFECHQIEQDCLIL